MARRYGGSAARLNGNLYWDIGQMAVSSDLDGRVSQLPARISLSGGLTGSQAVGRSTRQPWP